MRRAGVRLLREDNLRVEGEGTQAYVRLGHDVLAKVAATWRAEREKELQGYLSTRTKAEAVPDPVVWSCPPCWP